MQTNKIQFIWRNDIKPKKARKKKNEKLQSFWQIETAKRENASNWWCTVHSHQFKCYRMCMLVHSNRIGRKSKNRKKKNENHTNSNNIYSVIYSTFRINKKFFFFLFSTILVNVRCFFSVCLRAFFSYILRSVK